MSISPMTSSLIEPSSDRFFCFPDAVETQEISSNQERPLKDRVYSFLDRVGYKVYSSFNPPHIKPEGFEEVLYQFKKRKSRII